MENLDWLFGKIEIVEVLIWVIEGVSLIVEYEVVILEGYECCLEINSFFIYMVEWKLGIVFICDVME